jgi:hypothetical protein
MKKEALFRLIAETKPYLKTATPEQKVRFLRLVREGLIQYKKEKIVESVKNINADYLEEK